MRPLQERGPRPQAAWRFPLAFAAITGATYLAGLLLMALFPNGVQALDRAGMDLAIEMRSPGWTTAARAITTFGDADVVTIVIAIALTATAIGRSRMWTGFFAVVLVGALGIHSIVKPLVGRMRPDMDPLIDIGGHAFPSGHATAATVVYGAFAVVAIARWRGSRALFVGVAACLLAAAVGLSRVYLGVHWPTDVIAGTVVGGVWVYAATRLSSVLHGMG